MTPLLHLGLPWRAHDLRAAAQFVMRTQWVSISKMAGAAFLGGLAEALFLVTVTRAAFAITDHRSQVGVVSGWYVPVSLVLLLGLGIVAARIALAIYSSRKSAAVTADVVADARHHLAESFLHSSWRVQQEQRGGSFQELMTEYSGQASALVSNLNQVVLAGANLLALIGMAVGVNPVGALVLVVSVAALGLLLRPLRSVIRARARRATESAMDYAVSVNDVAELGLELHVFHVQAAAQHRVGRHVDRVRENTQRLQFATGLTSPVYSGLAYVALLGALAVVAESRAASLTSLGAAMLVMLRSLSYGQAAQGAFVGLLASIPALEELQRRLQMFQSSRRVDGGGAVRRVCPLAVEHVSFAYQPGKPVLHDLSFTILPREIVGIVGPSGSGKSTLVQLLLGLRQPDEGAITADGHDIATLAREEWARKVTFVPQEAHLIAGTIADNIRFLRTGVTQDDIERAARLAHWHDEVLGFPEAYQRQIGDGGSALSGGQQQRLCIARALVEHPDLLILDEPTSALDVRSEHLIRTTLVTLKQTMTVVVIAHRVSTLSICDRIMVIQDGRLKDFDTPLALEQSSGFYREALALSGMR